jgi:hypothetical protein
MVHIEEDTAIVITHTKILTTTTTLAMTSLECEIIHIDLDMHEVVTEMDMEGEGHTAQIHIATMGRITTLENHTDSQGVAMAHQ